MTSSRSVQQARRSRGGSATLMQFALFILFVGSVQPLLFDEPNPCMNQLYIGRS
jgi:hypothetical protein